MKQQYFILSFIVFIFSNRCPQAQTDLEFWFAIPEVSFQYSPSINNFDRPIYLRISSFDEDASVIIEQPSNPSFIPININISNNSSTIVDLTPYISILENQTPNTVLNYGLHITSSSPISCYYEVASTFCDCNPELFALKGRNALGTEFYIPGQNRWDNSHLITYSPTPYSSFDIVATEDNTLITIIPSNNIVGHLAGVPFNITLNKGQTYSAKASSQYANQHLVGSKVTSNNPIAVTIKDDLLYHSFSGVDLVGDQIVPTSVLGKKYIATKGELFSDEAIYILAIEDNTNIYFNGSTTPITTINKGDTYMYSLTTNVLYIETSKEASVFHLSGYEYEFAGSVLPRLDCSGSQEISFTRANEDFMAINIIVPNGFQNDFSVNGNTSFITASDFSIVPGTSGNWMFARLNFDTSVIPVNSNIRVSNSGARFQLGFLNGENGGVRYGYFTDYKEVFLSLSDTLNGCLGDPLTLDAGNNFNTYLWNNGEVSQSINVSTSGIYSVEITTDCDVYNKEFVVDFQEELTLNLEDSVNIDCDSTYTILDAGVGFEYYLWNTGVESRYLEVNQSGIYSVLVKSGNCEVMDTIYVTANELNFYLGQDIEFDCDSTYTILDAGVGFEYYLWNTGVEGRYLEVNQSGTYSVLVKSGNCESVDEINVTFDNSKPDLFVPNVITPTLKDGKNDAFVVPEELLGAKLKVYDRWGTLVYENNNYQNEWDANNLNVDFLVYFIEHQNPCYDTPIKGTLNVLK